MAHYLLSVIQPTGGEVPPPEVLEPIMAGVAALNDDMKAAGVWVFSGGLTAPESATVLIAEGGTVTTTDGPFLEGKEYLGGLTIIDVPDLDEALRWSRRSAEVIGLPIEVRAFDWSPTS